MIPETYETATAVRPQYPKAKAPQYPKGCLVVEIPGREVVGAFSTPEEAEGYAEILNRWLAARPSPLSSWAPVDDFSLGASEAALLDLVDRLYAPEAQLAALAAGIGQ